NHRRRLPVRDRVRAHEPLDCPGADTPLHQRAHHKPAVRVLRPTLEQHELAALYGLARPALCLALGRDDQAAALAERGQFEIQVRARAELVFQWSRAPRGSIGLPGENANLVAELV